jgi:hypothetical protein
VTVSAVPNPAAKALVAVLPAADECNRESAHKSLAVSFAPAAWSDSRDSDGAATPAIGQVVT